MNSKILLGVSISVIAIIGIIFVSISIEQTPTKEYSIENDLGIQDSYFETICLENNGELIKYDNCKFNSDSDLRSAQIQYDQGVNFYWIKGEYAEKICEIVDIPCPEDVKFKGKLDGKKLKYDFVSKTQRYGFELIGNSLTYYGKDLVDGKWVVTVAWEDPIKINLEDDNGSESHIENYSAAFEFNGDELGNYEKWCGENNGIWTQEKIACEYLTSKDHKNARRSLNTLVNVYVQDEASKQLCAFLKLNNCNEQVSFGAKFDMRTGDIIHINSVDEKSYEIRVKGDTIQYRPDTYGEPNSFSWVTFTESLQ